MPTCYYQKRLPFSGLGLLALLFFACPQLVFATDTSWTGSTSTTWSTNSNWTANKPGSPDNAVFNSTFSNQPNLTGNTTVGGLWMTGSIGQNVTISATSGTLTLDGNTINGTANLGILVDNTNAFALTISAGLKLGNAQTWMNSSGNLLTISGAVNLNGKGLTINGSGNTTISGLISSGGAFTKAGTGTLTLSNTGSTFTGQLTVQAGTLKIDTINNASANGELGNNALSVILGSSGGVTGTLEYAGGTASSTKKFTMAAGGTGDFQIDSSATNLTLSGVIDGSGGLSKSGAGTLTLTGANTYTGTTTITAGTLALGVNNAISTGAVTVNGATAVFGLGENHSDTVGTVTVDGGASISGSGTSTLTSTGSFEMKSGSASAILAGTGIALNKTTTGTVTLTGANTYTGGTNISGGSLLVNNASGSGTGTGSVSVTNSGTMLGGNGTISGAVSMGSGTNLSPGATILSGSTAILRTGALTLNSNSNFTVDLNGTTAGTTYDQVRVTGAVSITGSNIVVRPAGSLNVGDKFFVLLNDGSDLISGTFAQGATITVGGDIFAINYLDNGDGGIIGNDISLTLVVVPEPSTWVGAALAVGILGWSQRRRFKIESRKSVSS